MDPPPTINDGPIHSSWNHGMSKGGLTIHWADILNESTVTNTTSEMRWWRTNSFGGGRDDGWMKVTTVTDWTSLSRAGKGLQGDETSPNGASPREEPTKWSEVVRWCVVRCVVRELMDWGDPQHPTLPFLTTAWVLIPSRENQGDTHGTPMGYPPIHPTTPPLLPLTGPKTGDPQLPNHPHKGRKKGRKRGGKREYKSKFSLGENPQTPPQQ